VIIHIEATQYRDAILNGEQAKWRMFGVNSDQVVYIHPFEDNEHWTTVVFENTGWLVLKMNMKRAVDKLNNVMYTQYLGPM
jgi:hypothetical protein